MAQYFNLYRISSYLLVIFCLLHTFGGLLANAGHGSGADMVWSLMKSVHFDIMGSSVTWGGMYLGFGLLFSVFLLFSAFVTWYLGGLDNKGRIAFFPITWALFVSYFLVAVLSWAYFFVAPGVTATLIALLLGIIGIKTARPRR
jgi:hypothetical protein